MPFRKAPQRKLFVLDLIVLVTATSFGLVAYRSQRVDIYPILSDEYPGWCALLVSHAISSFPLLSAWATALLLLRFRPPRPRLYSLARQPGFIACTMILAGVAFGVLLMALTYLVRTIFTAVLGPIDTVSPVFTAGVRNFFLEMYYYRFLVFRSSHVGCAITVSWLCFKLSRRWRPPHDWIDQGGRLLGTIWIAMSLVCGGVYFFISS